MNSVPSTEDQPIFLIDQTEFIGLRKYLIIDTKKKKKINA